MNEHDRTQSALGTNEFWSVPAATSDLRDFGRRRCNHCGGSFGLIRRRRGSKQFCSVQCMENYAVAVRKSVEARARWYEFLYQRR